MRPSPSYHAEWDVIFPERIKKYRRTVALHDAQELGDDLGAGPDHDLALASLLGIVDALESVVEDGGADHLV